jgi:peroxisome-assembly ATPase
MESDRDYRKLAHHAEGLYFTSQFREQELEERFIELTNNNPIQTMTIDVEMGRHLVLQRVGGCVAYETFTNLCEKPLGAADYMAVAHSKHTLALSGIPKFDEKTRPHAYRFVTLIDILYENRIRLICSAEASPEALFENVHVYDKDRREEAPEAPDASNIVIDDNLGFVKDRTISRLIEMQSNEYLVDHANRHAPELLKALESCPTTTARKR